MRSRLAAVAATFLVTVSAALAGSVTVSTTAVKILAAPVRSANATAWVASTAYSAGATVSSAGQNWLAISGGTSGSTAPSGVSDFTDNTVIWRRVQKAPRAGLFLFNAGSTAVQFTWDGTGYAAGGEGIVLEANEKALFTGDDVPTGPVYAITESGSSTVVASDW